MVRGRGIVGVRDKVMVILRVKDVVKVKVRVRIRI